MPTAPATLAHDPVFRSRSYRSFVLRETPRFAQVTTSRRAHLPETGIRFVAEPRLVSQLEDPSFPGRARESIQSRVSAIRRSFQQHTFAGAASSKKNECLPFGMLRSIPFSTCWLPNVLHRSLTRWHRSWKKLLNETHQYDVGQNNKQRRLNDGAGGSASDAFGSAAHPHSWNEETTPIMTPNTAVFNVGGMKSWNVMRFSPVVMNSVNDVGSARVVAIQPVTTPLKICSQRK
jgi:hypothetical protein